jgi:hypothetical protein
VAGVEDHSGPHAAGTQAQPGEGHRTGGDVEGEEEERPPARGRAVVVAEEDQRIMIERPDGGADRHRPPEARHLRELGNEEPPPAELLPQGIDGVDEEPTVASRKRETGSGRCDTAPLKPPKPVDQAMP